jgi:DNA-binding NtrC family response regulator
MLHLLNAEQPIQPPHNQTMLSLRPGGQNDSHCPYAFLLKRHGIELLERPTLATARHALDAGVRVGLIFVQSKQDLRQLSQCESLLACANLAWVGLIAPELIALPQVRTLIREHLFNFIKLPADIRHLVLTLRHAWGMAAMRDTRHDAVPDLASATASPGIIGRSAQMRRLAEQIRKVARTDASLLITGPSGTGKELAALAVHRQSARKQAPFVAVNCGAIAASLFQSELFGYEKGAFTGAAQRRAGRIEAAQGGTLLLDEIGDLQIDMQVNLLRFLQEKTIVRVGGNETLPVDVRVIAATHTDLAEAVRQGKFREDLYYRLNVVCLATPKLAERPEDIEDIAKHYFGQFARIYNRSLRGFSSAALQALLQHDWPGNVRELVNRVQRAVVMAEGRFIQPEDLDFERGQPEQQTMSLEQARASAESAMIRRALLRSRNRISHAASLLGVSRVTLYRLIDKYGIRHAGLVVAQDGKHQDRPGAAAEPAGHRP